MSGPPVRLFTHKQRVRRRWLIAGFVSVGSVFAVLLTFGALSVVTQPDSQAHLGSTTFKVGEAEAMLKRIERDDYPLLFQDLRNKSIDIFVAHSADEDDPLEGWLAIEAHAPDRARTCQLDWTGKAFKDPCDGTTYPASGEGLRQFKVNVVNGVLYVNFRDVTNP